jgi:hypothetical protein
MKLPTLRQVRGFVMIVNTLLPAILVLTLAGIYVFLITPLKTDLVTVKTKVESEFAKAKDDAKAAYEPIDKLSEKVVTLSQQATNLVKAPDFCKTLQEIKLISAHRYQPHGAMQPVNGSRYPNKVLVRVSYRDWLEDKKDEFMKQIAPGTNPVDPPKGGAGGPGSSDLPGCAAAEKAFKKTFAVLDNVISSLTILTYVISPLETVSGFYLDVDAIYTLVRYPKPPRIPIEVSQEVKEEAKQLARKVKESAQRLEKLEIKKPAEGIGQRISTLLTAFKYLSIALAVWFVISYSTWIYGRLERGWKMVTAKDRA